MTLSSRRPYLIRAMYDWVVDNGLTPYLLVAADAQGVIVPEDYAQEGRLTLNVNPQAVQGLQLNNDMISFNARFGGRPFQVSLPPGAVLAIYARENGEGMLFGEEEAPEPPPEGGSSDDAPAKPSRSHLKVIK
jgi:stringent starvation protein B